MQLFLTLAGNLLILSGCICLGFTKAGEYQKEIDQYSQFIQLFISLKQKLLYGKLLLADAFFFPSDDPNNISFLIGQKYSAELKVPDGSSAETKWKKVLMNTEKLKLEKRDYDSLLYFSSFLNKPSAKQQAEFITLYQSQFEETRKNLEILLPARRKMCRGLGISAGIFIVLLLL